MDWGEVDAAIRKDSHGAIGPFFNLNAGVIEQVLVRRLVKTQHKTGCMIKRLKAGCRLDKQTGKCYRRTTIADIEVNQEFLNRINAKEVPNYIKQRIPK